MALEITTPAKKLLRSDQVWREPNSQTHQKPCKISSHDIKGAQLTVPTVPETDFLICRKGDSVKVGSRGAMTTKTLFIMVF